MNTYTERLANRAAFESAAADATVAMLRDEGVTGPRLRAAIARANGKRAKAGFAVSRARAHAEKLAWYKVA